MLLSTTTDYLSRLFTLEETLKMLYEAGYKAYDLTLYGNNNGRCLSDSEDYREKAIALKKYADSLGIICNQAHAFMGSSCGDPEKDKAIYSKIVRDMEVASILGAKLIVVHPKQHLKYADNVQELFEMNMEFYKSLIPYCEKFGIKVAIENMWQGNKSSGSICDSTCSRAWEFCKYVDALDSEWIVALLDVGHTALVDAELTDFIKKLGNKRLQGLHVHDNDLIHDSHTLPFTRNINFDILTSALAEIDYQGDFTYEADEFMVGFPEELLPSVIRFMRDVGDYLVADIQRKKQ